MSRQLGLVAIFFLYIFFGSLKIKMQKSTFQTVMHIFILNLMDSIDVLQYIRAQIWLNEKSWLFFFFEIFFFLSVLYYVSIENTKCLRFCAFISCVCFIYARNLLICQSLGYPRASLTFVNTDHGSRPQLKYLDGSFCPHDKSTKLSSQIEFYCDPSAGKVYTLSCSCAFLLQFTWFFSPISIHWKKKVKYFIEIHIALFDNNLMPPNGCVASRRVVSRELQFCKEFPMNAIMNLNGQRTSCAPLIPANSVKKPAKYTTAKSTVVSICMTFSKMVY